MSNTYPFALIPFFTKYSKLYFSEKKGIYKAKKTFQPRLQDVHYNQNIKFCTKLEYLFNTSGADKIWRSEMNKNINFSNV